MASYRTRKRVKFYKKCESWKMGYATRAEALDAAERAMERGQVRRGCHLMPYACDRCGEWHVANRRIVW